MPAAYHWHNPLQATADVSANHFDILPADTKDHPPKSLLRAHDADKHALACSRVSLCRWPAEIQHKKRSALSLYSSFLQQSFNFPELSIFICPASQELCSFSILLF